jgi:hypothetical protein
MKPQGTSCTNVGGVDALWLPSVLPHYPCTLIPGPWYRPLSSLDRSTVPYPKSLNQMSFRIQTFSDFRKVLLTQHSKRNWDSTL